MGKTESHWCVGLELEVSWEIRRTARTGGRETVSERRGSAEADGGEGVGAACDGRQERLLTCSEASNSTRDIVFACPMKHKSSDESTNDVPDGCRKKMGAGPSSGSSFDGKEEDGKVIHDAEVTDGDKLERAEVSFGRVSKGGVELTMVTAMEKKGVR
jgi:hypothetical protein